MTSGTRMNLRWLGAALLLAGSQADATPRLDGVWQQQGYGVVLRIAGDQVQSFDITTLGCVSNEETTVADLGEARREGEQLYVDYGINRYVFDPLQSLPDACVGAGRDIRDPLANFDSLWQTVDEHYAFFEQRGVDWNALRARYRALLDRDSTELQLYGVLKSLLHELGDGHVQIETPEALEQALEEKSEASPGPSTFELTQRAQDAIIARYLDAPRSANAGILRWGRIEPGIGYVQLNAMLMLADYELGDVSSLREFFGRYFRIADTRPYQYRDEVQGAERLIRDVLGELGDCEALIVDLRFNGGGKDEAALTFLRPLVEAPVRVFNKKARSGDGFTPPNWVTLKPLQPHYRGRVYLLTSARTASAAEIAVMASLALPQVTRIGSATEGIFSDTLDKHLPNGWSYTLSNEVYTAADGRQFESRGIEPDVRLDYASDPREFLHTVIDDLAPRADGSAGVDRAIEAALALARAPAQ